MLLLGLATFSVLSIAAVLSTSHLQDREASDSAFQTVYQFPNNTWLENLAVQSNGKILVTLITQPEVWEIDPVSRTAELVHRFPDAVSACGIAEFEPGIFGVAVGNWSITTFKGTVGSWSVWRVDMSDCDAHRPSSSRNILVRKVADMPNAGFLNGVTTLPTEPHTVMIADSALGVVYKVDMLSGGYLTAIDNPAFKPKPNAAFVLGINGIHFRDGYLYFDNSAQAPVLARVPLRSDGTAAGAVEVILANATYPENLGGQADDFALDSEGNAWVTTDPSSSLIKVTPQGEAIVVGGGTSDGVLAGDTAAAFGRRGNDMKTLYITTNGGLADPAVAGIVGGKLLAFDTTGL